MWSITAHEAAGDWTIGWYATHLEACEAAGEIIGGPNYRGTPLRVTYRNDRDEVTW